VVHPPEPQAMGLEVGHFGRGRLEPRPASGVPLEERAQAFQCPNQPFVRFADRVRPAHPETGHRAKHPLVRHFPRRQVTELQRAPQILHRLADQRGHQAGEDGHLRLQKPHVPVVILMRMAQQHAIHVIQAAVQRMGPVPDPQIRLVSGEIVSVDPFQRREETHPEVVAESHRGAGLQELVEEAAGAAEPHAEIQEPNPLAGLDQDLVAPDLSGGRIPAGSAAIDRDTQACLAHRVRMPTAGTSS